MRVIVQFQFQSLNFNVDTNGLYTRSISSKENYLKHVFNFEIRIFIEKQFSIRIQNLNSNLYVKFELDLKLTLKCNFR